MTRMFAATLDQAKTIGIVVVAACVLLAIASAWLMKQIVQKVLLVAVLVGLAAVVYFQRESLQDCADKIEAAAVGTESTCTFFGVDVTVPTGTQR